MLILDGVCPVCDAGERGLRDEAMLDPLQARRALAEREETAPERVRAALASLPRHERDAWIDRVLGIEEVPDDGPGLPRGCAPYLPCPVDLLLAMIEQTGMGHADVLVDLGSGLGRASTLVHFLTGASAIGIEVQSALVNAARRLAAEWSAPRVVTVEGDAVKLAGFIPIGTVFFLYCPFSGERLERVLDELEPLARMRRLRIACVQLPPLSRPWLALVSAPHAELAVYVSTIHEHELARNVTECATARTSRPDWQNCPAQETPPERALAQERLPANTD